MDARYIVKLTDTDLWLTRNMVLGYGLHGDHTYTWVLSPLSASRWETIKGAAEAAEKGIPVGHFEVFRLLESVEPIGTRDAPEVRAVVVGPTCFTTCGDKRNAWCRFWNCGE